MLRSTNWGGSDYKGLETSIQRRFSNGLAFGASYTLATSHDLMSGFHSGATSTTYLLKPQDSLNPEAEYAASDFDARHRFTASEIWELPFGAGRSSTAGRRHRHRQQDGRDEQDGVPAHDNHPLVTPSAPDARPSWLPCP